MNKITNKQIANKRSIEKSSAKLFAIASPPTSHFIISNELSSLLDSIELNGYITTYNKVNDKNNIPSTLYALDYGLCYMNNLYYGRPKDNKLRKYYNDTRFNFNSLVREHLNESQLLKCENEHEFPFELLDKFKAFGMQCPTCLQNKVFSECKVISSNHELMERIKEYEKASLNLDDTNEYNILDFLNQHYPKSFYSNEIGPEIDCSWQFVSKRANRLIERGLMAIDEEKSQRLNKRYFKITQKSRELLELSKK
jgi:DNA-binding MarR family transcriptional regulator